MKHNLVIVVLGTLLGCTSTEVDPTVTPPVVSLAVGNQFVYYGSALSLHVFTDWWSRETITDVAIIGSQRWHRFNTNVLRRADATRVYRLHNGAESVELDLTLSLGDVFMFDGIRVCVRSIRTDFVFGERQKVFELSNEGFSADTTFTITYATRFGRITSFEQIGNSVTQSRLVAAVIEGNLYGDTTLLMK